MIITITSPVNMFYLITRILHLGALFVDHAAELYQSISLPEDGSLRVEICQSNIKC